MTASAPAGITTIEAVSVVIPAFNREHEISAALESVFAQDYPAIEVIVVDDGSADQTCRVVEGYGSRVKLIRQANAGPGAARNRGVQASSGSILMFLDSDDQWHPTRVRRQVAQMTGEFGNVKCSWCNTRMTYSDGRVQTSFQAAGLRPALMEGLWSNVAEVVCSRFILLNQGIAVRRQAFLDVGGYDTSLRWLEDHDLALRLARYAPWTFIAEPLVMWVGGAPNSLSEQGNSRSNELNLVRERVLKKGLASPDLSLRCRKLLEEELWRVRQATELGSMQARLGSQHWRVRWFKQRMRVWDAIRRRLPSFPKMAVQGKP